jgi:hypothetical protein
MLAGHLIGPGFHLFGLDFQGQTTFLADQVVMVAGCAGPIKELALFAGELISLSGLGQIGQIPVNSGQSDGIAMPEQFRMQLLGADTTLGSG